MIQKPRGTLDILPEEIPFWRKIEDAARETAALYGFSEIRFPTFEATELFQRGVGGTTDVVQKEMYTFTDRDGRSLTLRPEGTASAVRLVLENGRASDTMPLKYFYLINCFRYEKPQAGRSREFHQFGVELFGAAAPQTDVNVVALADRFIRGLGIEGAELRVNSIGCPDCRPGYHAALKEYFAARSDDLCSTCRGRLETNPLRILDCKSPVCSEIAAGAPKTIDHLCPPCADHFAGLKAGLEAVGIAYTVDPKIVRGLDYYTRTVFEFVSDAIGAQGTLCGGGRYDGLMAELGGPPLPGIGFAMGITRLILAMKAAGVSPKGEHRPAIYIAPVGSGSASSGGSAEILALSIAEKLRSAGIYAECDLVGRSLKAQMKYADKIGVRNTLIIGGDEMSSGRAWLKNMDGGGQTEVSLGDINAIMEAISNNQNNTGV